MQVVEGGIEAQTEQALKNLKAVVEAAGSELGKVVKTTVCWDRSRLLENPAHHNGSLGLPEVDGRLCDGERHLCQVLWRSYTRSIGG